MKARFTGILLQSSGPPCWVSIRSMLADYLAGQPIPVLQQTYWSTVEQIEFHVSTVGDILDRHGLLRLAGGVNESVVASWQAWASWERPWLRLGHQKFSGRVGARLATWFLKINGNREGERKDCDLVLVFCQLEFRVRNPEVK